MAATPVDYLPAVPCGMFYAGIPHDPHPYMSLITGGPPGPTPTITCLCPGYGPAMCRCVVIPVSEPPG